MVTKNTELAGKIVCLIILATLFSTQVYADDAKLNLRWRKSFPQGLGAIDVYDIDSDKNKEVLAADSNNTIYVFDVNGSLVINKTIYLPSAGEVGSVYALKVADMNKDGLPELIVGLGGRRDTITHAWNEYYNLLNESVGRHSSFLYRSMKNGGGLMVANFSGYVMWRESTPFSVNDLQVFDSNLDGKKEVLAGTGSYNKDEYWENKGYDEAGKEIWDIVEYSLWNASAMLFSWNGTLIWSFDLSSPSGSNKIRSVDADNLISNEGIEIILASDNGILYLLNDTGKINAIYNASAGIYFARVCDLSQTRREDIVLGAGDNTVRALDSTFNLLWKYKLSDIPQVAYAYDIESDGKTDLFVGGRDVYIYLLQEDGTLRWKHFLGEPVYHIAVSDLDQDEIPEVITGSNENLTVFDFNNEYIKREIGNTYYSKAYDEFTVGDLLLARIHAEKARELFLEARDTSGLPKIEFLLSQIGGEVLVNKKSEAEYNYGRALELYGKNKYEDSRYYILKAKDIYLELNDSAGTAKVNLLLKQIEDEIRLKKTLEAKTLYDNALSYLGFRNFTAAKQNAEEAKKIYVEIGDIENALKAEDFVIKIGDEYFDSARRSLIGLDYKSAREQASKAKEIYMEYNYTKGVKKVSDFELEMGDYTLKEPNPIWSSVNKILPYVLVILIILLIYSFIVKRKAGKEPQREKSISKTLERELEEVA